MADYRYTTYGERTKVSGDGDSDFGYAGLFHHKASGLNLATYCLYDAKLQRWISRDPLGEGVDYNLYRYCGNDPVNCVDPSGLLAPTPVPIPGAAQVVMIGGAIVNAAIDLFILYTNPFGVLLYDGPSGPKTHRPQSSRW